MKIDVVKLVISIAVCQAAGVVGSFFTTPYIATWYAALNKPFFNPPNWIFAPVWTTLFLLMGISLYLVWINGIKKNRNAVGIFGAQLALNVLWSLLFFYLQRPLYAFIEIVLLWVAILLTMIIFRKVNRNSALLMIPYIAWVSFAALLNYYIWLLN